MENLLVNTTTKTNVYHLAEERNVPSVIDGDFFVEAKNLKRETIFSSRFNSKTDAQTGQTSLSIALPFTADVAFIDIYKESRGMRIGVGSIVVPVDLLEEEIKYIPEAAFVADPIAARQGLLDRLDDVREAIIDRRLNDAAEVLLESFIPLARLSLKDDFQPSSVLDVGLAEINALGFSAVAQISAIQPAEDGVENPFLKISSVGVPVSGTRGELKGVYLNAPSDGEHILQSEVYFDGVRVQAKESSRGFDAASLVLSVGSHVWQVKSYLVSKRLWESGNAAISRWRNERSAIDASLEDEQDPEKIEELERKKLLLGRKIVAVKSKLELEKRQVGGRLEIRFEVQ